MGQFSSLAYLAASVCFIMALRGLSHPEMARQGLNFGMAGMGLAGGCAMSEYERAHPYKHWATGRRFATLDDLNAYEKTPLFEMEYQRYLVRKAIDDASTVRSLDNSMNIIMNNVRPGWRSK